MQLGSQPKVARNQKEFVAINKKICHNLSRQKQIAYRKRERL